MKLQFFLKNISMITIHVYFGGKEDALKNPTKSDDWVFEDAIL